MNRGSEFKKNMLRVAPPEARGGGVDRCFVLRFRIPHQRRGRKQKLCLRRGSAAAKGSAGTRASGKPRREPTSERSEREGGKRTWIVGTWASRSRRAVRRGSAAVIGRQATAGGEAANIGNINLQKGAVFMTEVRQLLLCKCDSCGLNKYAAQGATVQECIKQAGALGWSVDLSQGRAWCEACAHERRARIEAIERGEREAALPPIT